MLIGLMVNCALADDEHEVKLIGDKNFTNKTVRYDGIDVSNYQKDINWEATAKDKNIKYVYIKATEGASHKQHRYRRNLENARKHGIKVGSYHFMRTSSSIQSQFNNFISLVKREEQDLVPLLDVETRAGWTIKQLQDSVLKFVRMLERHYGCKPMIYTSSSYFNDYLGEKFAGYPLFIARYSKTEPTVNFGAKWILWQFSDRGRIEGIDAMVDLSRFNKGCSVDDIAYKRGKKSRERISSRRDRDEDEVPPPSRRNVEEPAVVPYPNRRSGNLPKPITKEEREIQERGREAARKRLELERKEQERQRKEEERLRKEEEKKQKEIKKRWEEAEKRRKAEEKKQLERDREAARKRLEMERKEQEKQRKEEERLRKAEEKKQLEEEKKRQAEEKKRVEEEKKRIEKERKRMEQERKRIEQERKRQNEELKERSRHSAQERMRAEKEKNHQLDGEKKRREEQARRNELEQAKQERQQAEQAKQEQLSAANQASSTSKGKSKTGKRVVKGNNQSSADNAPLYYSKKKKATQW